MDKILMFSGSNSPKSLNQTIIKYLAEMIDEDKREVIDLHDLQLPIYSVAIENENVPEQATSLKKKIMEFDKFIIAVPEHNGSVSAFFKNTMDWLTRVEKGYKIFMNKEVLLISVSPVMGTTHSLLHAEAILKRMGATIVNKIGIPKIVEHAIINEAGIQITDTELLDKLKTAIKIFTEQPKQTM